MQFARLVAISTSFNPSGSAIGILIPLLLSALSIVAGHTLFTNLIVDGIDQGDATCVRMPMTPQNATFPINDLQSTNMACGYDGMNGVVRVCPVPASSNLKFQFREYPDNSQPGAIDSSHLGPCAVYMKHVGSAIKDPGVGDGWFKVASMGYDDESKKWCTQKLAENNGVLDLGLKIPEDLAGGYYLVRPELLSLHQADKTPPNPQFYAGCAQVFVASEGNTVPKDTVKIPGYVEITDKSVLFNIYNPVWPYTEPGPEIYVPGRSPGKTVELVQRQEEGLLPRNAKIVNANWWGFELDAYANEEGCWNASKSCYTQADACYKSAPPTGSKNCKVWEHRCSDIQGACKAQIFTGPPSFSYPPILLPTTISSSMKTGDATTSSSTVIPPSTSLLTFSIASTTSTADSSPQSIHSESTTRSSTTFTPQLSPISQTNTDSISSQTSSLVSQSSPSTIMISTSTPVTNSGPRTIIVTETIFVTAQATSVSQDSSTPSSIFTSATAASAGLSDSDSGSSTDPSVPIGIIPSRHRSATPESNAPSDAKVLVASGGGKAAGWRKAWRG